MLWYGGYLDLLLLWYDGYLALLSVWRVWHFERLSCLPRADISLVWLVPRAAIAFGVAAAMAFARLVPSCYLFGVAGLECYFFGVAGAQSFCVLFISLLCITLSGVVPIRTCLSRIHL